MKRNIPYGNTTNNSDDFLTPPAIVQSLGVFDLDPCVSRYQEQMLATKNYRWPEQDGLILPWEGRVWCNPPYDRQSIPKWAKRFALHANGIMLVPARVHTRWFQLVLHSADAILIPEGRILYWYQNKWRNAHVWSDAFLAIGKQNVEALKHCITGGFFTDSINILPSKIRLTVEAKHISLLLDRNSDYKGENIDEHRNNAGNRSRRRSRESEREEEPNLFSENRKIEFQQEIATPEEGKIGS